MRALMLLRYDRCPNCKTEKAMKKVQQCEAGHLFCEECSVGQYTPLLSIKIETCPTCGHQAHESVGWIGPERGKRLSSGDAA
jgi:hypothetical protein